MQPLDLRFVHTRSLSQKANSEMPCNRTIEPEKPIGTKLRKHITYSGRMTARAEDEGVGSRGRRAYGATLEGECTRTRLLKCLVERGRTRQISIEMTIARSNHAPLLLHLQVFRAHHSRVGSALHRLTGPTATDIIGGITWNHRHWKIVTILQRNRIRVRLCYSSQKFELSFSDCPDLNLTIGFALQLSSTITGVAASNPLGIEDTTSPPPNESPPEWIYIP